MLMMCADDAAAPCGEAFMMPEMMDSASSNWPDMPSRPDMPRSSTRERAGRDLGAIKIGSEIDGVKVQVGQQHC